MSWAAGYIGDVLLNWYAVALILLGLNDLSRWLGGPSWPWLHVHRWKLVVLYLIVAQAMVHRDTALRLEAPAASAIPIMAENPDHAGLVDRVDRLSGDLRRTEVERDAARAELKAAEGRITALESERVAGRARTAQCNQLAGLSTAGVSLIAKLRATRAAPETRREIDAWFGNVCSALSPALCAAFMAAPPAQGAWVGYPVDDGGYSQTLRGRSSYLSTQLLSQCR